MQESKERRGGDTWPKSGAELGAYIKEKLKEGDNGSENEDDGDVDNELISPAVEITKTWGADEVARDAKVHTRAQRSPEQESMVGGMVSILCSSATLYSCLKNAATKSLRKPRAPVSYPSEVSGVAGKSLPNHRRNIF